MEVDSGGEGGGQRIMWQRKAFAKRGLLGKMALIEAESGYFTLVCTTFETLNSEIKVIFKSACRFSFIS